MAIIKDFNEGIDPPKPVDAFSFILAYEDDALSEDEIIEGFQHLINTGLAWQLQGHYGRTAASLIEAGLCHAA